jgi:hypothetical protein
MWNQSSITAQMSALMKYFTVRIQDWYFKKHWRTACKWAEGSDKVVTCKAWSAPKTVWAYKISQNLINYFMTSIKLLGVACVINKWCDVLHHSFHFILESENIVQDIQIVNIDTLSVDSIFWCYILLIDRYNLLFCFWMFI